MKKNENVSVVVGTCDNYEDLWEPFFWLFHKYWEDCPYKIYIGTEKKECKNKGVYTLHSDPFVSWTRRMESILNQIDDEYIVFLLEDFFLNSKIDQNRIDQMINYMMKYNVDCVRLIPSPPPCHTVNKKMDLGLNEFGAPYYVSAQPSIWKRESLVRLLDHDYSPWQFEIVCSKDPRYRDMKFRTVNHTVYSYNNGVERGHYYLSTIEFLKKEKIDIPIIREIINDKTVNFRFNRMITKIKMLLYVKLRAYKWSISSKFVKHI